MLRSNQLIGFGARRSLGVLGNDANALLLLHMDGSDASTTFTDSSASARSVTPSGNAQIDTASSKFGGASGLFDGTGDYLTVPYAAGLAQWWLNDFTLETWINPDVLKNEAGGAPIIIGHGTAASTTIYWGFGPISTGALRFYYFNGSIQSVTSGTTPVSTGSWQHIAMTNESSTIKLWHNGTNVGSAAISGTPQASASFPIVIGQINSVSHDGWLDELRISNVARWTGNFTPPTGPYV